MKRHQLSFPALALLALSLLLSTSDTRAALRWRWSNPLPHGNNVADMIFANGLGVQVTERGQIYSSYDLISWTRRESPTTNALRALTYFNGQFVITCEQGTILAGSSLDGLSVRTLNTTDWLEGIANSSNLAVAVGDNGAIYTSSNALSWQRQTVPFTDWLRSVAYGVPFGVGRFVAVGETGTVAVSNNGASWQKLSPFTSQHLNRVAWNGSRFIAVGASGVTYTSDGGLSWRSENIGATNELLAIAPTLEPLIAGDSELHIYFSSRSLWSNELDTAKTYPAPPWTYLAAASQSNSFYVAGRTGLLMEGFRTNAGGSWNWLPLVSSPRSWLWQVRRWPQVYITVGDLATVMTSLDGAEWDVELAPESLSDATFLGVGGSTNTAIACGNAGSLMLSRDEQYPVASTNSEGTITTNFVSGLGISWQAANSGTTADLQGVAYFQNQFLVSGSTGTLLASPDAMNWSLRTTPTTSFLSCIEPYSGGVILTGSKGTLLTSPDAITWTARSTATTNWIYRVRAFAGKFIAVGQNGTILTSEDAQVWTKRSTSVNAWLNDVTQVGNTYFIVGTQGTILSSADASTWTVEPTLTGKSFYSADQAHGQLIVAGVEGVILRSQIVPRTDPIFTRYTQAPRLPNILTNTFAFSGYVDQKFAFDSSPNLENWTQKGFFEFLSSSEIHFYSETLTNPPPQQFFRTRLQLSP